MEGRKTCRNNSKIVKTNPQPSDPRGPTVRLLHNSTVHRRPAGLQKYKLLAQGIWSCFHSSPRQSGRVSERHFKNLMVIDWSFATLKFVPHLSSLFPGTFCPGSRCTLRSGSPALAPPGWY